MPVKNEILFAPVEELWLDQKNPRLRRDIGSDPPSAERLLDAMLDWSLEELCVSFVENGLWVQEALVVIYEQLEGEKRLVVVEGNRRLAALKLLRAGIAGEKVPRKIKKLLADSTEVDFGFLEQVPYMLADDRAEVQAFLGFRHVNGIREWEPAEKAAFIASLVDDYGMTFRDAMRKIGSNTPTVRKHYISHRIMLQLANLEDDPRVSLRKAEGRFSVLYLSLRTQGVQQYLQVDIDADEGAATQPVPKDRLEALTYFASWLFGTETHPPVLPDSREIDRFGRLLESERAVDYLTSTRTPVFDTAWRKAGGDERAAAQHLESATDELEAALGTVHLFAESKRVVKAVGRLVKGVARLLDFFPAERTAICEKTDA